MGSEGWRKGGREFTHESFCEIGTLVWAWWAEVGTHVGAVLCSDDGILVFVCFSTIAGKGFGEPVRGADEGGFRVDILGGFYLVLWNLYGMYLHRHVAVDHWQKCFRSLL